MMAQGTAIGREDSPIGHCTVGRCLDNSILAKDEKIIGIDYDHCKGCGICAHECPEKAHAIEMKLEAECILTE